MLEIDAASNRGIDQIRELREMVRYAATGGHYKIVILDEAHQLTDDASNALLKTLEEPPDKVIFILATTQPEDLEDTIKSRAQLFQFRSLTFCGNQRGAGTHRESGEAEDRAGSDRGAGAGGGRKSAGFAIAAGAGHRVLRRRRLRTRRCASCWAWWPKSVLDELMDAIANQSTEQALTLVHRLISDGHNLQHFCREAIRHMRNLLVAQVCGADSELIAAPPDERPRIAEQAAAIQRRGFDALLSDSAFDG